MTAEIAIINRQAIALAADSAVTVGREKVWKTANKLFSLGPQHDIAIMIYGSGDFLSLPWEVVVKEFRRRAASKSFKHVRECAEDFKAYLHSKLFDRENEQRYSVLFPIFDFLAAIAEDARDDTGAFSVDLVRKLIDRIRGNLQEKGNLFPDLSCEEFTSALQVSAKGFAANAFGKDVADQLADDILGLTHDFFCSKQDSQYSSGIVVAGFGTEEFFPCLMHYTVDGRFGDRVRWWEEESDCKDLNAPDADEKFPIIPFAQKDMSFLFMAGISPGYLAFLDHTLSGLMEGTLSELVDEFVAPEKRAEARASATITSKATADAFMEKFRQKVTEEQFAPINRAVSALPKEEMAAMAEALVDITSLKRKVDSRLESVGGPVDVAVISKGDGFVWIKRKHYFKLDLNPDFMRRRKALNGEMP